MKFKTIVAPMLVLGSVLLMTGCATPYASGSVGARIGSGGYVSGSMGGDPHGAPYGYRDYSGGMRVHGYDRNGNPIYRTPDGRLVQGYDPYRGRGVNVMPGYGYPSYGHPRAYPGYGYPGYGYSHPGHRHSPRAQRPSPPPRPDRGNNAGPGTPPPAVMPRPPRNSSPLGNVVREERRRRDESRERARSAPARDGMGLRRKEP